MMGVEEARKILQNCSTNQDFFDRPELLAFATLSAWTQHFPLKAQDLDYALVEKFQIIKTQEPDRYYKQRRMALSKLATQAI